MGKVTSIAIGMMVVFALVGLMSSAMFNASSDTNKKEFDTYEQYKNFSELNEDNLSVSNTEDSVSNMQRTAEAMANKIAQAQRDLKSDNPVNQVLGAFGLLSAITIDVIFLLLAVLLDGVNFIGGVILNVSELPTPWNMFGSLGVLGIAIFIVYTVFKIGAALTGRDI